MKKVYLLDTNIISEFSKDKMNPNVAAVFNERKNLCAISSVTWQELVYGVSRMAEGKRKAYLTKFIEEIKNHLEIIPYDDFAANICGQALGAFENKGKSLPICDTQIAATAISNGMILVTHNTSDFEELSKRCFLRVEDWFER